MAADAAGRLKISQLNELQLNRFIFGNEDSSNLRLGMTGQQRELMANIDKLYNYSLCKE